MSKWFLVLKVSRERAFPRLKDSSCHLNLRGLKMYVSKQSGNLVPAPILCLFVCLGKFTFSSKMLGVKE